MNVGDDQGTTELLASVSRKAFICNYLVHQMRMNEKIRINYLLSKIKSPDFETRLSEIIQV